MQLLIEEHIEAHQRVISSLSTMMPSIVQALETILNALKKDKTIFFLGNGGSAADAQHLAAELICRFRAERRALPAIALTTDTSVLTALGNDYDFSHIFVRQIEGLCRAGDVVVALSTSGNSGNVIKAVNKARERGATVIGMTGERGGLLGSCADVCCKVPSDNTARIQEAHILIGHAWCDVIEKSFLSEAV